MEENHKGGRGGEAKWIGLFGVWHCDGAFLLLLDFSYFFVILCMAHHTHCWIVGFTLALGLPKGEDRSVAFPTLSLYDGTKRYAHVI